MASLVSARVYPCLLIRTRCSTMAAAHGKWRPLDCSDQQSSEIIRSRADSRSPPSRRKGGFRPGSSSRPPVRPLMTGIRCGPRFRVAAIATRSIAESDRSRVDPPPEVRWFDEACVARESVLVESARLDGHCAYVELAAVEPEAFDQPRETRRSGQLNRPGMLFQSKANGGSGQEHNCRSALLERGGGEKEGGVYFVRLFGSGCEIDDNLAGVVLAHTSEGVAAGESVSRAQRLPVAACDWKIFYGVVERVEGANGPLVDRPVATDSWCGEQYLARDAGADGVRVFVDARKPLRQRRTRLPYLATFDDVEVTGDAGDFSDPLAVEGDNVISLHALSPVSCHRLRPTLLSQLPLLRSARRSGRRRLRGQA